MHLEALKFKQKKVFEELNKFSDFYLYCLTANFGFDNIFIEGES